MKGEVLKGHLDLLILAALENHPAHGYAIVEIIQERSQGEFNLPEGTIYPALHRLEKEGLLESGWVDEKGRNRRVYRLTGKGLKVLEQSRQDWKRFTHAVNGVIEGGVT